MFVPNLGNPLHQLQSEQPSSLDHTPLQVISPLNIQPFPNTWQLYPISTNQQPITGIKRLKVHGTQDLGHNFHVSALHPSSGQSTILSQHPPLYAISDRYNALETEISDTVLSTYQGRSIKATTSNTRPSRPHRIPILMPQASEEQGEENIQWQLLTCSNLKAIIARVKVDPPNAQPQQTLQPSNVDVTIHGDDPKKASREAPASIGISAHHGNLRSPHLHESDGSRDVTHHSHDHADCRTSGTTDLGQENASNRVVTSPPFSDSKSPIKSGSDYNNSINNPTFPGPRNLPFHSTTSVPTSASPLRSIPHFPNQHYVSATQQISTSQSHPNHDTHPHAQGNVQWHGNTPSGATRQEPTVNNVTDSPSLAHVPASKPVYSHTAHSNSNVNWNHYPREAERWGVDAKSIQGTEALAERRYGNPSKNTSAGSYQVVPGSGARPTDSNSSRGEGPAFKDAKPRERGVLTQAQATAPANPGGGDPETTMLVDGFSVLGAYHPVEGLGIGLNSFGAGFQNNVSGMFAGAVTADSRLDTRLQAQRAGVPQTDWAMVVDMEGGHKDGLTGMEKSRDHPALGSADTLRLTAKPTRKGLIPVVELPIRRRDKGKGRAVPLIPFARKSVRAPEETSRQKEQGDGGKGRLGTVTNKSQVTPRKDASTEAKSGNTAQRSKAADSVEDDGGERVDDQKKRKRPRTLMEEIFGDSSEEEAEDNHDTGLRNDTSYSSVRQAANSSEEVIELSTHISSRGHYSDEEDGSSDVVEAVRSSSRPVDRRQRELEKENPFRRTSSPASSSPPMPKAYPYNRKPSSLTQARRHRPILHPNPANQKFRPHLLPTLTLPRVIEWVNELNRLNYLLEFGKISEKDSRDLDDLLGMINANKEHPMLSWEILGDAKLAVALRPFRHKSAFSSLSRAMARDIYAFWAERWEWAYSAGDV